jgi:hypothetical protein
MPIEIRETIVTPVANGQVVQLHISDVPLDDEGGAFRLVLRAKLPSFRTPLVRQLQREAMKIAQDKMTDLLKNLASEIQKTELSPEPHRLA